MVKRQYSEEERKLLAYVSLILIFITIEWPINLFLSNELLGLIFTIINGVIVGFMIYYLVKLSKKLKSFKNSNLI
jgi:hypothetical protein